MVVTTGRMLLGVTACTFLGLAVSAASSIVFLVLAAFITNDAVFHFFAMWCLPVYCNALMLAFAAYGSGAIPSEYELRRASFDRPFALQVQMGRISVTASFFTGLLVGISIVFYGYMTRGQHEPTFVLSGLALSAAVFALVLNVTLIQRNESLANMSEY